MKMDATNHHILNNVQIALKEKSEKVKAILQAAMKADLDRMQQFQQPVASLLAGVEKVDTDAEAQFFNQSSSKALNKFPKPTPIYYRNHHVGVCKGVWLSITAFNICIHKLTLIRYRFNFWNFVD